MRVALTGGATGIGAEVAARLKQDGHTITVFDITEPQRNCDRWVRTDLGDPASIDAALSATSESFDALINNAGLSPRPGRAQVVLNVNFIGFRHFLFGMLDRLTSGASIVNTASKAGAKWRENIEQVKALMALTSADQLGEFIEAHTIDHVRAYDLSKEAVIVMTMAHTEVLKSRELRMNSVSPAAVSTDILQDFVAAFGDRAEKAIARVGRPGEPAEVANVIAFLAGPDSSWIRGSDVTVDGGMGAMMMSDAFALEAHTPRAL